MFKRVIVAVAAVVLLAGSAWAHFGMVIPQAALVERPGQVEVEFRFWHPMENQGMTLAKPKSAGVDLDGEKTDLLPKLEAAGDKGGEYWKASYQIKKPGDYIFYMEPQPYWEPAEDCFIVHYTKTVVSALGAEEGWQRLVGSKIEIVPLTRPYGLWAGNSFTGRVLYQGAPLAGVEVEVEYYNKNGEVDTPAGAFITQVVRTDSQGVFTYTMPWAGWWGFAALATDDKKMKKDGDMKPVELGAVLWVQTESVR